jgi:hypothetical protein
MHVEPTAHENMRVVTYATSSLPSIHIPYSRYFRNKNKALPTNGFFSLCTFSRVIHIFVPWFFSQFIGFNSSFLLRLFFLFNLLYVHECSQFHRDCCCSSKKCADVYSTPPHFPPCQDMSRMFTKNPLSAFVVGVLHKLPACARMIAGLLCPLITNRSRLLLPLHHATSLSHLNHVE